MNPPEVPPDQFNTRHLSLPSETESSVPSTTGPLDLQRPWVVEFRVVGTASTIKARVVDAMIIGRADTASGFTPEVDLMPFDALSKGVSRKHALITIKDQRLMLRDLNSTNGTRLNNALCTPGEEYRLRHGNELALGSLRLQVSFAVVPAFTDTQHGTTIKEAVAPLIHSIGKRILVVESDEDVGSVFRSALEGVGYRVTLVTDVIKGFGIIFQGMPDVIVLDLMEPDTNGLDLIRFVRKQKTPQHIPILAVSGALAGYQMNQALSAGADAFLGKPVSVEALLQAVANAFKPAPPPPELMGLPTDPPAKVEAPPVPAAPAQEPAKPAPTPVQEAPKPITGTTPLMPKPAAASVPQVAKPTAAPVQPTPKPAAAPVQPTPKPTTSVQPEAKPVAVPPKPEPAQAPSQVQAAPVEKPVKVETPPGPSKDEAMPLDAPVKAEPSAPSSLLHPQVEPLTPRS